MDIKDIIRSTLLDDLTKPSLFRTAFMRLIGRPLYTATVSAPSAPASATVIAFTQLLPFNNVLGTQIAKTPVTALYSFSNDPAVLVPSVNATVTLILTANGNPAHIPNFSAYKTLSGVWNNSNAVDNLCMFWYDGVNYNVAIAQPASAIILTTPAAPTAGTVNDALGIDTFDFTYNPIYTTVSDYEYTLDGGATASTLTAKPLVVGNITKSIGQVGVRVKAHTGTNPSAWLFNAQGFTSTLPTLVAPVLTAGTPTATTIPLTWTDPNSSPNETNFLVERSANGTTGWSTVNSPAQNIVAYTDSGLANVTTWYYRITAIGDDIAAQSSIPSNVVSATTGAGVSSIPILLNANMGYTNLSNIWTVTAGGAAWNNVGVSDQYLPANTSGRIFLRYTASDAVDAFLGFNTVNLGTGYPSMKSCFRITGGTLETRESGAVVNQGAATIGRYYSLYRDGATGVITLHYSTDSTVWTFIATMTFTSLAALYISTDINGGGKLYTPSGNGIVAIPTVASAAGVDITFAASSTGITNAVQVITPTVIDAVYGHKGLDAKSLAANVSGRIWFKYTTGGISGILGFSTSNALSSYLVMLAGFEISTPGPDLFRLEAGAVTDANGQPGLNYYFGMYRDGATGAMKLIRSADALNWMDIGVNFTVTSVAQLFLVCDLYGAANNKLDHPQGYPIA